MKFHIVRNGETLEKIMFLYQVKEDELKEANRHIKNFKNLIPGSKLRIPIISEAIDNDILEMEPFIEDYYPKEIENKEEVKELIKDEEIRLTDNKEIMNEDEEIVLKEDIKDEEIVLKEDKKEDEEKCEIKDKKEDINKKKDNKQHRLSYYPYYYYDPYTRRYYVYYYPYYI